jgi:NhaA family Na+:H+ antiporter
VHWVNDGLMTIFFVVVGLEIKREVLVGELASPRKTAIPIAAAVGGIAAPALVYVLFNVGKPGIEGWAIPAATDIAFALGVIALLGPRVPTSLKVFLTAMAIVDDIVAVLIIAVFYTSDVSFAALLTAGVILGLLIVANATGVRRLMVYGLLGITL